VRLRLASLTIFLAAFPPAVASAAPPPDVPIPGVAWLIPQLLPSPEWNLHDHDVSFGLRWQITPISYSFGVRRGVFPLRFFVVEPLLRHSGSTELYLSPEWLHGPGPEGVALRVGLRSYFGLIQNGESLSVSIGTSYLQWQDQGSAAYEIGAYTLYGILGLQVSYDPKRFGGTTTFTLSVRYF
jgi:hypothetical protein